MVERIAALAHSVITVLWLIRCWESIERICFALDCASHLGAQTVRLGLCLCQLRLRVVAASCMRLGEGAADLDALVHPVLVCCLLSCGLG